MDFYFKRLPVCLGIQGKGGGGGGGCQMPKNPLSLPEHDTFTRCTLISSRRHRR